MNRCAVANMNDFTQILSRIEAGDLRASEELLPLVYEELRKLAAARLAQEHPGQTLQATALVHEAYLRLVGSSRPGEAQPTAGWNSRGHFFGAAAEAMRRILVEQARRKQAMKRGGQRQHMELTDVPAAEAGPAVDLLSLDQALTEFTGVDPPHGRTCQTPLLCRSDRPRGGGSSRNLPPHCRSHLALRPNLVAEQAADRVASCHCSPPSNRSPIFLWRSSHRPPRPHLKNLGLSARFAP